MTVKKGNIFFAITQILLILILLFSALLNYWYDQRFVQGEGANMEINVSGVHYIVMDEISSCQISFADDSVLNAACYQQEGSIIQYKKAGDTLFLYPLKQDQIEFTTGVLSLKLPPGIKSIKAGNSEIHVTGHQYYDLANETINWLVTGSTITFDTWKYDYFGYFSIHDISANNAHIYLSGNTMFESMQIELDTSELFVNEENGVGTGTFSVKADNYSRLNMPGYLLKGIMKK